jgi:hypothetical protein
MTPVERLQSMSALTVDRRRLVVADMRRRIQVHPTALFARRSASAKGAGDETRSCTTDS